LFSLPSLCSNPVAYPGSALFILYVHLIYAARPPYLCYTSTSGRAHLSELPVSKLKRGKALLSPWCLPYSC
jgi:hypothetical protein